MTRLSLKHYHPLRTRVCFQNSLSFNFSGFLVISASESLDLAPLSLGLSSLICRKTHSNLQLSLLETHFRKKNAMPSSQFSSYSIRSVAVKVEYRFECGSVNPDETPHRGCRRSCRRSRSRNARISCRRRPYRSSVRQALPHPADSVQRMQGR